MRLYKLTDEKSQTYNEMQWGENITHSLPFIKDPILCSGDVIHAYKDINLAYLLNPIHASYRESILYEAGGNIVIKDWGKVGCFSLTTVKQINKPVWVDSEIDWKVRLQFAILCAESVQHLNQDNRVIKAIQAAKNYLNNPSKKTARAAAGAARAARAAAEAAEAAARAARAAAEAAAGAARAAAEAAAGAARAARAAAEAAAGAARAAAEAAGVSGVAINFIDLANQAVKIVTF